MAQERIDPGGNTEQWRVFAHGQDPVEPKRRPIASIVFGVVVVALVLAGLALLAFM